MSELFNAEMMTANSVKLDFYGKFGPSELGMIDTKTVSAALYKFPDAKSINVRINSQGGSAFEGLGIYNLLKSHPASVHVRIDGVAASAASLVAMAGDTIDMPANALLMIHDPQSIVQGDAGALSSAAEMLTKLKDSCCQIYADKSGKSIETIAAMMTAETWLTGTEAAEHGFATKADKSIAVPKLATPAAVLSQFKCAPDNFAPLVSLSYEPQEKKEPIMADTIVTPPVVETISKADVSAAAETAAMSAVVAERKRSADILSLCKMAGKAELSEGFIAEGKAVADVQMVLLNTVCEERKLSAGGLPKEEAPPVPVDENTPFKAEYATMCAMNLSRGLSEADYVASRRIDVGLDSLTPKLA